MKKIVGVRIRENGKINFYDPGYIQLKKGEYVIVQSEQGEEYGKVLINDRNVKEQQLKEQIKKVIRIANKKDKMQYLENQKQEKEALKICEQKVKEYRLKMKLINAEYTFDRSKLLFYFSAEDRIDFREMVKDLASIFKTRIELRQIGVRDEVRKIGGNGVCGRELCCCSFLNNFDTVSIKMAKEQNISLNPTKISGNCGRLMCCLKYEQEVYEEKLSRLPKQGEMVETEDGRGIIDYVEILKEEVRVKFKDGDDYFYKKYKAKDVKKRNQKGGEKNGIQDNR